MPVEKWLIGSAEFGGSSYITELGEHLGDAGLTEAIIASAFLTEQAAEQILLALAARPYRARVPHVRLIVGSMQNFTRKKAISACLKASKTLKRVRLETLHPDSQDFHIKAAYFKTKKRMTGIVGSHNLTTLGLSSQDELGVIVTGKDTAGLKQMLEGWSGRSISWSSKIRGYKESRSLPPTEHIKDKSKRVGLYPGIGDCGASVLAEDMKWLSDAEDEALGRVLHGLPPSMRKRLHGRWFDDDKETLEAEYGYFPGAVFDSCRDDSHEQDWYDGQKRAVYRVSQVVPVRSPRGSVLLFERTPLIKYEVNRAIAQTAESLGIRDYPEPEDLRTFVQFVVEDQDSVR